MASSGSDESFIALMDVMEDMIRGAATRMGVSTETLLHRLSARMLTSGPSSSSAAAQPYLQIDQPAPFQESWEASGTASQPSRMYLDGGSTIITFGKMRGVSFEEAAKDTGYSRWIMANISKCSAPQAREYKEWLETVADHPPPVSPWTMVTRPTTAETMVMETIAGHPAPAAPLATMARTGAAETREAVPAHGANTGPTGPARATSQQIAAEAATHEEEELKRHVQELLGLVRSQLRQFPLVPTSKSSCP